jgi:hypothetical protein
VDGLSQKKMNTHATKKNENKSHLAVHEPSQKKSGGESPFQFADNRPEAIQMQKLRELANNSPRVKQLKAIQENAVNAPRNTNPKKETKAGHSGLNTPDSSGSAMHLNNNIVQRYTGDVEALENIIEDELSKWVLLVNKFEDSRGGDVYVGLYNGFDEDLQLHVFEFKHQNGKKIVSKEGFTTEQIESDGMYIDTDFIDKSEKELLERSKELRNGWTMMEKNLGFIGKQGWWKNKKLVIGENHTDSWTTAIASALDVDQLHEGESWIDSPTEKIKNEGHQYITGRFRESEKEFPLEKTLARILFGLSSEFSTLMIRQGEMHEMVWDNLILLSKLAKLEESNQVAEKRLTGLSSLKSNVNNFLAWAAAENYEEANKQWKVDYPGSAMMLKTIIDFLIKNVTTKTINSEEREEWKGFNTKWVSFNKGLGKEDDDDMVDDESVGDAADKVREYYMASTIKGHAAPFVVGVGSDHLKGLKERLSGENDILFFDNYRAVSLQVINKVLLQGTSFDPLGQMK